MAKLKLKEGEEPLKGIYCGYKFYLTERGEQCMMGLSIPNETEIEGNAAKRAERIIALCVSDIQERMQSQREAMAQYRAIRARVQRDYAKCCEQIPENNKLRKAIVNGYFQDTRKRPSRRKAERELKLDVEQAMTR